LLVRRWEVRKGSIAKGAADQSGKQDIIATRMGHLAVNAKSNKR